MAFIHTKNQLARIAEPTKLTRVIPSIETRKGVHVKCEMLQKNFLNRNLSKFSESWTNPPLKISLTVAHFT